MSAGTQRCVTPLAVPLVANLIATSEAWRDKQSGQMPERTEWHRVVFWARLAEIVGEYVKKAAVKIYYRRPPADSQNGATRRS